MTAILKEEKRMDTPAKTYLQIYEEYINGYKQYKMEKGALSTNTAKGELVEK
ncbi:MAG TPA: hypothetical protein VK945_06865 [Planococcus sp. (in: firmicutes)]|nr:hypothetical protein [Planococcus sp. (in: firmicutes)]